MCLTRDRHIALGRGRTGRHSRVMYESSLLETDVTFINILSLTVDIYSSK